MIDPASAIIGGTGIGAILRVAVDFLRQRSDSKLEELKEKNRHEEVNNQRAVSHMRALRDAPVDKGEPYHRYFRFYGIEWESEGTRPDRYIAPAYNGQFWLLTATYCGAIAVCFACADIAILERPVDGGTGGVSLLFGLIETSSAGARVYVQTLGGLGSALLATASVCITYTLVGISGKKR